MIKDVIVAQPDEVGGRFSVALERLGFVCDTESFFRYRERDYFDQMRCLRHRERYGKIKVKKERNSINIMDRFF
jgi:hypothetical protein